jgi:hypothetical protein
MNRTPRRIDDLLAALVLEDEAGICDAVEGDAECLLLLAEIFERCEEWIERSPPRSPIDCSGLAFPLTQS